MPLSADRSPCVLHQASQEIKEAVEYPHHEGQRRSRVTSDPTNRNSQSDMLQAFASPQGLPYFSRHVVN